MIIPKVQILLSSYNGEAFLADQIESILAQSYTNWQVLIRDDGSTDSTLRIIATYCEKYPKKIFQLPSTNGGNSTQSFFSLLNKAEAPYIMFCDQDDIWESNKIELSLSELQKIEKNNPISLVFSDMKVVSSDLSPLHESFMKHQKLKPNWVKDRYIIFSQNIAAGCTMMFTQSLKNAMQEIDTTLFQHDHWVLINAKAFGEVSYLAVKTVLYRQHYHNVIGSHPLTISYFYRKILTFKKILSRWKYIQSHFQGVSIFLLMAAKLKVNLYRLIKLI